MALPQTDTLYDAIIVGSGAGGGMAAYQLSIQGMKILVLEAGRDYDPVTETPMFKTPRDAPLRAAGNADKPFGFYDATVDGGWRVPGEPYTTAPGSEFQWWRSRMLGGRTNHWGRISLRMGEYDFKPEHLWRKLIQPPQDDYPFMSRYSHEGEDLGIAERAAAAINF